MTQNATAFLFHAEAVFSIPLGNESLLVAGFFHYGSLFGLEKTLPADVQPVGEIADVHQSHLLEFVAHRRIELPVDLTTIHHRRTAAFRGRDDAEETDSSRPGIHVRALVVVQNGLVCWIGRGGVDLSRDAFAWQVPIL